MRARAKRDLATLIGVIFIVVIIFGINTYVRLGDLKEAAERARKQMEAGYRQQGFEVLDWQKLRETKGTLRTGPKFTEDLKKLDGRLVNIVGFMNPIDQFRDVEEFMLLPLPISCYFCSSPPARDIIHVKLEDSTEKIVNEPVLIGGKLVLNEETGKLFFQAIETAQWNEPVKETQAEIEHLREYQEGFGRTPENEPYLKQPVEEELLPGAEPPQPGDLLRQPAQQAPVPQITPGQEMDHPGQIPAMPEEPLVPGAEPPQPEQVADSGS